MSFSDKDLEKLEKALTSSVLTEFQARSAVLNIRGLIKRLTAAEALALSHSGCDEDCDNFINDKCSCEYEEADAEWCKTKGAA